MKLIDKLRGAVESLGRPATPKRLGGMCDMHPATALTTMRRAGWAKTDAGAYYPPDRTPFLLDGEEAKIIKARRAGDEDWIKVTPKQRRQLEVLLRTVQAGV